MSARKRRALDRFLRADRSALPIPGLFGRGARELARRRPETLAAEWMLGYAFTWRRLVGATAGDRPQAGQARRPAPAGAAPGPARPGAGRPRPARDRRAGPPAPPRGGRRRARADQPARAGARRGARAAAPGPAPRRARRAGPHRHREPRRRAPALVAARPRRARARGRGRDRVRARVGGDRGQPLRRLRGDGLADRPRGARVGRARAFLYLIRRFEPLRHPAGTLAALAAESYGFPHAALYSSELLREHFRRHGIGVYGEDASAVYEDAVTDRAAVRGHA